MQKKSYTNLASYVKTETQRNLYLGIPERLDLIQELVNAYNDWMQSLPRADGWKSTPCFTLENISIFPTTCEDERVTWQHYQIKFPAVSHFDLDAPFANYENLPPRLLGFDDQGQRVCATGADACDKCELFDVVGIMARLMFRILFGHDAFVGRAFYEGVTMTEDERYEFFSSSPAMIFEDIQNNPNRFINSYHDKAWLLWNRLNADQKEFWKQAFDGGFINFDELRDAWLSAYSYVISTSVAPCGQAFTTLVFNKKSTLIVSDNAISPQLIHCRGCFNHMIDQCRDCQRPERIAKFQTLWVCLERKEIVERDDDVEELHSLSRKMLIHDGMIIKGSDFPDLRDPADMFMVVASTKRVNLIGLKNLRDVPVIVTQNGTDKAFPKNSVIPLLPGVQVPIGNHYYLAMITATDTKEATTDKGSDVPPPAQPAESPKNSTPPPAIPPVVDIPSSPKPAQQVPEQTPPTIPPVKEPIQSTTPHVCDDEVLLEDGSICRVDIRSMCREAAGLVYDVADVKSRERLKLVIFNYDVTSEQLENMRLNIHHGLPHPAFQLPIALIKDEGFGKGKHGYVMRPIPKHMNSIKRYIRSDSRSGFFWGGSPGIRPSVRKAMLNIVDAFASLHKAGLCYKVLSPDNIYMSDDGSVMFFYNDFVSPVDLSVVRGYWRYRAPEVALQICEYDQTSDCFSMAIILFMLCVGVHPFDGMSLKVASENGGLSEEQKLSVYRDNPVYIFHPDANKRNEYFIQQKGVHGASDLKADYYRNIDYQIRNLFDATFTCGMVENLVNVPMVERKAVAKQQVSARVARPTIQDWEYLIRRWVRNGL